ncbi:hypothetical protein [Roseospira goensis]|uniref:Uncharacterized protein n=1 Tax=Roseospira goensis TaxID=391922 RepID=A0A7W6WL77_9PROT|nr:hypothetical protein [Roseospira goensis]MBB4286860.1 hypothetical protein [Roseospira goensis]
MKRDTCSPLEHLAGVVAVVGLSMILHAGLHTGATYLAAPASIPGLEDGPGPHIAAPDSAVWGRAVLRLNGMP